MSANPTTKTVVVDYTNWEGKRRDRIINISKLYFGDSPYHPEEQWLLEAVDVETGKNRIFAMSSIHSWRKATPHDLV